MSSQGPMRETHSCSRVASTKQRTASRALRHTSGFAQPSVGRSSDGGQGSCNVDAPVALAVAVDEQLARADAVTAAGQPLEVEDVAEQQDARSRRPVMVWVTSETEPLVKTLSARHRGSRVQTNTLPSGPTSTVDAPLHQRLSHTSTPCFGCDPKHPHGGGVRIVHFTERLEAVDERHAADDAAADLCNKDLTAGSPSSDVTQFTLVELVPGIAERPIRRNGQFASDLVLGRPHGPNDQRRICCHPPTLSGSSSGREHGEALLDPLPQGEKLKLLLAQALVLGAEPCRLAHGLRSVLDQRQVALRPSGTRTSPIRSVTSWQRPRGSVALRTRSRLEASRPSQSRSSMSGVPNQHESFFGTSSPLDCDKGNVIPVSRGGHEYAETALALALGSASC